MSASDDILDLADKIAEKAEEMVAAVPSGDGAKLTQIAEEIQALNSQLQEMLTEPEEKKAEQKPTEKKAN